MTSLKPFTIYSITIAAQTAVGIGPVSQTLMLKTREGGPSASPTNLILTSVTSTTVTMSWEPPPPDLQNGIIRKYTVKVANCRTGNVFLLNTTKPETQVGMLHPYYHYCLYSFAVSAVTVEPGPFSDNVTVRDAPTGFPTMPVLTAVDSTSILIDWDAPPLEEQNGIIRQYIVNVMVSETAEKLQFNVTSSNTSLVLNHLHPYYNYSITVAAVTVSDGPFSQISNIQTPEDVPSEPPGNVSGETLSPTRLILT